SRRPRMATTPWPPSVTARGGEAPTRAAASTTSACNAACREAVTGTATNRFPTARQRDITSRSPRQTVMPPGSLMPHILHDTYDISREARGQDAQRARPLRRRRRWRFACLRQHALPPAPTLLQRPAVERDHRLAGRAGAVLRPGRTDAGRH